jgi:hypothetical protein
VLYGSGQWRCRQGRRRKIGPALILRVSFLPFKLNQDRRRHISKQKPHVTNWREYDASLRQRGSLTVLNRPGFAGGSNH